MLCLAVISSTCKAAPVGDDAVIARDGSHFDYIIVGGGLSGLVVANRLTEDQNSTLSSNGALRNLNLQRLICDSLRSSR